MKLTLGLGMSAPARLLQTAIQAIYSQSAATRREFDKTPWNPSAFTLYAKLERSAVDNYNADEMQIYVGSDNYRQRVQLQVDNDTNRTMRIKIRDNNIDSFSENFPLKSKFLPSPQKYALSYDGTNFNIYMNGIKIMSDNDALIPSNIDAIAVGQDSKGTLASAASSIDFEYYDQALSDSKSRTLTRNTEMLTGIAYSASRRGIFTFGQSNIKGPSTLNNTPIYTNTSLIKNLDLAGNYENYADPYQDKANNLFGSSLLEATNPGTSYIGYVLDDLADDGNEYFSVGAAEGNTDQASDWKLYSAGASADKIINNLPFVACNRLLMGMQAGNMIAMINHQGESDALLGTSETAYKDNFIELISELRAVRGSNIPLIIVGLHTWDNATGASQANWNNIDLWRSELAASISNAAFVDISDMPARSGDEFHLRANDHSAVALRISNAIQNMI